MRLLRCRAQRLLAEALGQGNAGGDAPARHARCGLITRTESDDDMDSDINAHLGAIVRAARSIRAALATQGDDDDSPRTGRPAGVVEPTTDDAVVGHRKLRAIEDDAEDLRDSVHELLTGDEYPGHERMLGAARALEDRLRWLLGGRELASRLAGAGHLLDHGVRVVERLLAVVDHEAEDVDVAQGWLTRVSRFQQVDSDAVAEPEPVE